MMNYIFGFILACTTLVMTGNPFPSSDVKTLDGATVNTDDYTQSGKLTVISFWASWCSPCKRELDAIAEYYEDWQADYDVQLLAITIDNQRSLAKVPAIVETKGWKYEILADPNQDLMRMLNFQTIPQTFVVDQNGEIIYSHNGYNSGDEFELEDVLAEHAQ